MICRFENNNNNTRIRFNFVCFKCAFKVGIAALPPFKIFLCASSFYLERFCLALGLLLAFLTALYSLQIWLHRQPLI